MPMKPEFPMSPADLTDEQVAQLAMRVALLGEEKKSDDSDADQLARYLQACPWVAQDSPAMHAALRALGRAAVKEGTPSRLPLSRTLRASSSFQDETKQDTPSPSEQRFEQAQKEQDGQMSSGNNAVQTKPKSIKKGPPSIVRRTAGHALRSVVLDLPMASVLALYLLTVFLDHVRVQYLKPQLDALVWTNERSQDEQTYYDRHCVLEDLSTQDPTELFLPLDATPQEARDHQLKHGFTVFPAVLSKETSSNLREFVVARNKNLSEAESIFVIENQNRYSFGLNTHEPEVAAAVQEISNHPILTPALEHIIGDSPALIELTAITSSYGAINQYWHDDVVSQASPVQFARTFGPSYSLFIQLQDTTAAMGATGACPGTHFCTHGKMEDWCETDGFQLVTNTNSSDVPVWSTGDALLMNMDSWHRGAAHTDPNAQDRVMMIITIVPKPVARAESRQMAQGITFSLRWDHWGMTWQDFQLGRFWMPFLRALSIFKSPWALWGMDYISSSSMRMANYDNGFQREDLDTFIERGGFPFLPTWLEGTDAIQTEDDSWYEFLTATVDHCHEFFKKIHPFAVAGYLAICILLSVGSGVVSGTGRALRRVILAHAVVYGIYYALRRNVDGSGWARDILTHRRYDNPFVAEQPLYPLSAPTVYPDRSDVLIATRYGSPQLHMYNDYISAHPGNRKLAEAESEWDYTTLRSAGDNLKREAVAQLVWPQINTRILHQSVHGTWRLYSDKDAMTQLAYEVTKDRLMERSMEFLQSEYKYGIYRMTALAKKWTLPHLRQFWEPILLNKPQFVSEGLVEDTKPAPKPAKFAPLFTRSTLAVPTQSPAHWTRPASNLVKDLNSLAPPSFEPYPCAWCKSGDLIEAFFPDDNRWYPGQLKYVTASGRYHSSFFDGTEDAPYRGHYRPFMPYRQGEFVEMYEYDLDQYVNAKIAGSVNANDGTYFHLQYNGRQYNSVHPGNLRRRI